MRWMLLAASAAIAAALWLPVEAAQPALNREKPAAPTDAPITFAQYRTWRLTHIESRRRALARELTASDLTAPRKAHLEQVKAYYDHLAGLSDTERDRLFRARFDRIDTDHDGTMDRAERVQWRAKQRALYRQSGAKRQPQTAAAAAAAAAQ